MSEINEDNCVLSDLAIINLDEIFNHVANENSEASGCREYLNMLFQKIKKLNYMAKEKRK